MTNLGRQYLPDAELRSLPFGRLGRNVLVHERANIINLENLTLGDNVRIDADVTILATGPVVIGNYIHIGAQCYLAGGAGIEMRDFSGLSQGTKVYSTSDDYSGRYLTNPTVPHAYLGVVRRAVLLDRHVIIGAGSVILPGVTVTEGCAVGALSLVTRRPAPWGIYAGARARRRAERKRDLLTLEAALLEGGPPPDRA
jgi:galactoside O-acetyltransferase